MSSIVLRRSNRKISLDLEENLSSCFTLLDFKTNMFIVVKWELQCTATRDNFQIEKLLLNLPMTYNIIFFQICLDQKNNSSEWSITEVTGNYVYANKDLLWVGYDNPNTIYAKVNLMLKKLQ